MDGDRVQAFARLIDDAAPVEQRYEPEGEDPWAASPLRWFRHLTTRRRGAAGERIAAEWLTRLGHDVTRAGSSDYDRLVDGARVEIKVSTLWADGVYSFQQIRDQAYDAVLMFGLSPDTGHAWLAPKADAFAVSVPQHGGASGVDTRWVRFRPDSPPEPLARFGGPLDVAEVIVPRVLAALTGRSSVGQLAA